MADRMPRWVLVVLAAHTCRGVMPLGGTLSGCPDGALCTTTAELLYRTSESNDVEQVTAVHTKRYGEAQWEAEPGCTRLQEHGVQHVPGAAAPASYIRDEWDVCEASTGYPGKALWGYRSSQFLSVGWKYECSQRDTRCFSWQTHLEYPLDDCAQHAHEGAREQLVCVDPYRANRPIPLDFNGTQSHLKWDDSYDVKLSTVVGLRFPRVKVPYNASVSHAWISFTGVADPRTGGGLDESADIDIYLDPRPTKDHATPGQMRFSFDDSDPRAPYGYAVKGAVIPRNESAPAFGPAHLPAAARALPGNAPVHWAGVPVFQPGSSYSSPNIASLVERKVRTPGWRHDDAIAIVLDATAGRRVIASSEHRQGSFHAPVLHVVFSGGTVAAPGAADCGCDPAVHASTHTVCVEQTHRCHYNALNHRDNMPDFALSKDYWAGSKEAGECNGTSVHTSIRVTHHQNQNKDFHRCKVVHRGTSDEHCACCDCLNGEPSTVVGCRDERIAVRDAGASFEWFSAASTDTSWDEACTATCQGQCSASHGVVEACVRDAAWAEQGTLTNYWDSQLGQISFGGPVLGPDGACRLGGVGHNLFQCRCFTPGPGEVFISEYVEGSCNTKAIELHNPTTVDIIMTGSHLQWHHSSDFYGHRRDDETTDVNAIGYDVDLNGQKIPAGGTFVLCREQRVTASPTCTSPEHAARFPLGNNTERLKPLGPCDMVVGDSAECAADEACDSKAATRNAVRHTGDDSIELRLDARPACYDPAVWGSEFQALMESVPHYDTCGDAVDVIGIPGRDVDQMSAAEREAAGAVDAAGNVLFRDHTLRRKIAIGHGSPTWDRSQWEAQAHDVAAGSGVASVDTLGSHLKGCDAGYYLESGRCHVDPVGQCVPANANCYRGPLGGAWLASPARWTLNALPAYPVTAVVGRALEVRSEVEGAAGTVLVSARLTLKAGIMIGTAE